MKNLNDPLERSAFRDRIVDAFMLDRQSEKHENFIRKLTWNLKTTAMGKARENLNKIDRLKYLEIPIVRSTIIRIEYTAIELDCDYRRKYTLIEGQRGAQIR